MATGTYYSNMDGTISRGRPMDMPAGGDDEGDAAPEGNPAWPKRKKPAPAMESSMFPARSSFMANPYLATAGAQSRWANIYADSNAGLY